jgi:cytochrome P450
MADGALTSRRPPGPAERYTVQDVQRDPLRFLTDTVAAYGDIAAYEADTWSVVLVNRPEFVRHVLQDNSRNYNKTGTPDLLMLKPMLGDGLLTSDGENWVRQRRLAQPAFQHDRIEAFASMMIAATLDLLDRWRSLPGGEAVDLTDEMTGLTTRIVARALFSVDISDAIGSFGQSVQAMNEFMGAFDPHDRTAFVKFQRARTSIDALVRQIIQQRRSASVDRGDFLSTLLAAIDDDTGEPLSDRQVRDQVMTLLMAGHETTAKALTWTFYLLDRHPEWQARVRAEIAEVLGDRTATLADVPRLRYAWMVIQEAMRLFPPVWIIARMTAQDDEMGGYDIPAGTLVLISPYTMHRHRDFWTAPDTFDPGRFDAGRNEGRTPFSYLPFSGGPRQCIGKHFATLELQLLLATIVQRTSIRVAADREVAPEALVTLRPRGGLPVHVEVRSDE